MRKLLMKVSLVLSLALISFATQAQRLSHAAQDGDDPGQWTETCAIVPRKGATAVVITAKSNSEVLLQGKRGKAVVWTKKVPLHDEINSVKTSPVCKGRSIELYSQMPFSAFTVIQKFSWDGANIKYVSTREEDPSAEFVEKVIRAAEVGDTRTLRAFLIAGAEGDVAIFYPFNYVNAESFAAALKRGHAASANLFKAGRAREAAARLALMFDATASLNKIAFADDVPSQTPARWLETWKAREVEPSAYLPALNDYGYYLQQSGDHRAAVSIFNAVIERDPQRTVAFLNLADSLWDLNRKDEARLQYKTYQRMMTGANLQAEIPARVAERLQ